MDLKQITSEKLIFLDCDFTKKEDVLRFLVERLYDEGKIASKEDFLKAVMERESLSETGISDGVAIPHGKSSTVRKAAFAFARMKKPVADWESLDESNEVTLVFLLAIPTSEAGSTHLDLLAALMGHTQDEAFLNKLQQATSPAEIYESLDMDEAEDNDKRKDLLAHHHRRHRLPRRHRAYIYGGRRTGQGR